MSASKPHRKHNSVRVTVVTTQQQLMHALYVRSICFMEGEKLSVDQAFDGNDFQATHVVVYADDEPIGAARVRWFRDFAKIERTAFRPDYRDPRTLKRAAEFIFAHAARKGYDRIITHAGPQFAVLWQRLLGFHPVEDKAPLVTADYPDCIELIKELEVPKDAISLDTDLAVLYRIEGSWDVPTWLG